MAVMVNFGSLLFQASPDLGQVVVNIELGPASFVAHVTDLAEYRPFAPGPVVHSPDTPGYAALTVGVATVQGILVVEVNGIFLFTGSQTAGNDVVGINLWFKAPDAVILDQFDKTGILERVSGKEKEVTATAAVR